MTKLTKEEILRRFHEAHGVRYDYSLMEYKSLKIPIKIICQKHGVFEQTPEQHCNNETYGGGCPKCSPTYGMTVEEEIEYNSAKADREYENEAKKKKELNDANIYEVDIAGFWHYIDSRLNVHGLNVNLVPNPKNKHDPNAIEIHLGGIKMGHVPADDAYEITKKLKKGYKMIGEILPDPNPDLKDRWEVRSVLIRITLKRNFWSFLFK